MVNRRARFIAALCCAFLVCLLLDVNQGIAANLQSIIGTLRTGIGNVASGQGHFTLERHYTREGIRFATKLATEAKGAFTPQETFVEGLFAFEGNKLRSETRWLRTGLDGQTKKLEIFEAFDGEIATHKTYFWDNDDIPLVSGMIDSSLERTAPVLIIYDLRYWVGMPFAPYGSYLDLLQEASAQITGEDMVHGEPCEIVEVEGDTEWGIHQHQRVIYRLWLSQPKNLLPVKVEVLTEDGALIRTATCSYRSYGPGLFLIEETRMKEFVIEGEKDSVVVVEGKLTVSEDFSINIDIPDDFFRISFPPGISVTDRRAGHIVRQEGQ